jgi:hypothetical protein
LDVNWTPDVSSFVTLAACQENQTAKEHFLHRNGLFTGVLLDVLESDAVDQSTTFERLIELVGKNIGEWQDPMTSGDQKTSRLFFRDN